MEWKQLSLAALLAASAHGATVFSKASNDTLLWGPYRSNTYFGIRPRIPESLLTGLLWGRVEDLSSPQRNIRFTCEQHAGMQGYGWDKYDIRTGGVQTIHDTGNGIDIETSFVKLDDGKGGWVARIKGTPREDAELKSGSQDGLQNMKTAVWLTISLEGEGAIEPKDYDDAADDGFEGDVVFNGQTKELGDFEMLITEPKDNKHPEDMEHPTDGTQLRTLSRTLMHSVDIPTEDIWQSHAMIWTSMKNTIQDYGGPEGKGPLPPAWHTLTIFNKPGPGNMHMMQRVYEGPFEFDIHFSPLTASTPSRDEVTKKIKAVTEAFDKKHENTFQPQAPFTDPKYSEFSKAMFSNLVGGIGYFAGDQLIDRSNAEEYLEESPGEFWLESEKARERNLQQLEGPYELFTAVPSRPFFPRGFLWDEGFHLLPILEWDPEVVMQIVSSWYNTMDEDGWIAREQILGKEARNKVPKEFQVQYPHYANPPTLFMVLEEILDTIGTQDGSYFTSGMKIKDPSRDALSDPATVRTWLEALYPLLQRNYNWYRKTQWGDLTDHNAFSDKEGYRWRGRSEDHCLPSGLDDYPRALPPDIGELHVDLLSWMGLMTDSLVRVATYLGETDDAAKYSKIAIAVRKNLDSVHWSKKENAYCDTTVVNNKPVHDCHKGYITLFPFMTGMIDAQHKNLKHILDLIGDRQEIWSRYGIRSLSLRHEGHGRGENYWRSPIWVNMNYLIIKQLYNVATVKGPQQEQARDLYQRLRKNLVNTVFNSWKKTGFAWEQYSPQSGNGQRTQHFTGWTSLVVKIMSMRDLPAEGAHGEL